MGSCFIHEFNLHTVDFCGFDENKYDSPPLANVVLVVVIRVPVGDTVLNVSFSLNGRSPSVGISAPSMNRNCNKRDIRLLSYAAQLLGVYVRL